MNRDEELRAIAARILDVPTLERRHRDHLDFHEVAVGQIKAALEAAFDAGQATTPTAGGTPAPGAADDPVHDLRDVLERLLADVEAIAGTPKAYGMPVEDPDHPFHDSVTNARSVLTRTKGTANR